MKWKAALFVLLCANFAKATEPTPTVGPTKGTLVIAGGGGKDHAFPQIFTKFVELAGGKDARIVIVPTASSSDPDFNYLQSGPARFAREKLGVSQITVLHTHDRAVADTEAFVEPITKATGVWFGGGRQWRFTKAYGGTRSETEFAKVLERGGVIAGSSAGATIQGSFLARGDTRTNTIMIGNVQRGFGYLRNTAIDQHVVGRGRQLDLIKVLEDPKGKMQKKFDRSAMLGIGIDEDVAIVVKGDQFEVIGKKNGAVLIYDPRQWTEDTPDDKKWITLRTGERFDLHQRKPLPKKK
ncbi:cyanophycinase [Verrucomicrobiaceae bacterium 227]